MDLPPRKSTTATQCSAHFVHSLSIDISSYLIPEPTMCDIGCAGFPMTTLHPLALQQHICPTNSQEAVVIPAQVFQQEDSIFLGDRGARKWLEINQITLVVALVITLCFLEMEVRSSSSCLPPKPCGGGGEEKICLSTTALDEGWHYVLRSVSYSSR